ncbi:MAG: ATP-binding protein [Pseudomonadota bacterium]
MYLKRFVFVNWGNVPNGEFEFGPLNLFSGASGSGKTTAADAIQTIMTAAKSNLFNYNPGQDETTQKGKGGKQVRTLSSYVLGCDDGSFARTQLTDGYLAALFHPSQGEPADPFVALIGVRADLDSAGKKHVAREIDAKFMILPFRHDFNIHDVIESNPARVMPLDRVVKQLKAIYGSSKSVEEYSTKKGYLSRLYGALRGRHTSLSEREANAAAKAFSRFMAYKPVASINDFVASEILDKRDLGEAISNISSMMKTINAMEQDAKRINDAIDGLELANREANHYIDNWIKFNSHTLTLHQAKFLQGQQRYRQEKLRCQELKEAITANEDATVQLKINTKSSVKESLI